MTLRPSNDIVAEDDCWNADVLSGSNLLFVENRGESNYRKLLEEHLNSRRKTVNNYVRAGERVF